jgi:hypothetical protein
MRSRAICRIGSSNPEIQGHQFLQRKSQGTWSTRSVAALKDAEKEQSMEYLILGGVASTLALYALIIVECIKNPEW